MKTKKILCRCCNMPLQEEYIIGDDSDQEVLTKDNVINLNKKFFGRYQTSYFCLDCLCDNLEMTDDEVYQKMKEFKDQGCELF